ncbi:MAG: amidohydrolase family protein [bacterium]
MAAGGNSNVRNLPHHAAKAASYGLPVEEALRSITLYPAEILGVADRLGSLEVGKDATLIVTDGNPLEFTTNVEKLYLDGRDIDLNNKHKSLYHKYREKYIQRGHVKPTKTDD